MKIQELQDACRLYGLMTGFDSTLARFRASVAPGFDPFVPEHRLHLLKWLNAWACRQFSIKDRPLASASLEAWAGEWLERLPAPDRHLTDLTASEVRTCFEAYESLGAMPASRRALPTGKVSTVTYGPTGAAKTLFALRPLAVPPWDEPIRLELERQGVHSFRAYLARVAEQLRSLSAEAAAPVQDLPAFIGRPASSPPKLIDEYNWIVITRRINPTALARQE
jgi:hypothetical protein